MEYFAGYWKDLFSTGFMACGSLVLIAALLAANRIILQLPKGKVRRNWSFLGVLLGLLILSYISFAVANWKSGYIDDQSIGFYAVPLSYFLCACIVYLIISFVLNSDVYFSHSPVGEFENLIDPVMGIYTQRYLDSRLQQEICRSQRYNIPLSVMLLSIDNIRQFSDAYGKKARDQLLGNFATLTMHSSRITDIAARYGEAEIMVIATNTPASSVSVFADRIRKAMAGTLEVPKNLPQASAAVTKPVEINLSIGISGVGPDTKTRQTLVKSAENALEKAKELGSNMTVINKPDSLSI